ncbi:SRPBCC domain-containing protein [Streptomyces sp. SS]|uniref:SRPBCC domain-containing protein n=1 Tax=Streptomyces sp. SS TaxID=260742 RepID=UPI0002F05256|nr:SRPBCC domain-containing protein [Streptomyces sp. SS]
MRIAGEFTTPSSGASLAGLTDRVDELTAVPTLDEVTNGPDGSVCALFSPVTPFGRLPLRTRIRTERADADGAVLAVHARRAQHAVDVTIELGFVPCDAGSRVTWSADLTVRGPAASVGQRVAREVAARAIAEVLQAAASLATPLSPHN